MMRNSLVKTIQGEHDEAKRGVNGHKRKTQMIRNESMGGEFFRVITQEVSRKSQIIGYSREHIHHMKLARENLK